MPDFQITPPDPVAAERERCAEILALAEVLGGGARIGAAVRAIRNGDDLDTFKARLIDDGHAIESHFTRDGAA
jgi:hypothetical protein